MTVDKGVGTEDREDDVSKEMAIQTDDETGEPVRPLLHERFHSMPVLLRTQLTVAPIFFSKLTEFKTKFGISC